MTKVAKNGEMHGNPKPKLAHKDNPYLMQNRYKEAQKNPKAISKAIANVMMFNGKFEANKDNCVKTLEETATRLNDFFEACELTGQLPTVEKMYIALGMSRFKNYDWHRDHTNPEMTAMIDYAKGLIASMDAELASNGVIQPIVYIFRAKNFYGMTDQVNIQATTNNPLEDGNNRKLIEDKYKDYIDVKVEKKSEEKASDSIDNQSIDNSTIDNSMVDDVTVEKV